MRNIAYCIGWEIWSRNRNGILGLLAVLIGAGVTLRMISEKSRWAGLAEWAGYILLVLLLSITFGFFHFTEGQRRGGFGRYPYRLFHRPVRTAWLVAYPMLYGVGAILAVYLSADWLIFQPLGKPLPILWPSLYLICGFTQYQMIIWSFPEKRYFKLFCLSVAAMGIAFAWMFFMPHMLEGTLADWGYPGSPETFKAYLFTFLILSGPVAYGVSLYFLKRQRHGRSARQRWIFAWGDWIYDTFLLRKKPFASMEQAMYWQEWRQTGFILPLAVGVVLVLTCVPSYCSGVLSGKVTVGLLSWMYLSPVFLAVIIGRGMSKPDFWKPDLEVPPFAAVRPWSSGQWIMAKIKVTLWSVVVTWVMVVFTSFLWVVQVGDFWGLEKLYQMLCLHYPAGIRWMMVGLALWAGMALTWRGLVSGWVAGFSGNKVYYYAINIATACGLAGLLALLIWRGDYEDHPLHLYDLWNLITWLPWMMGLAVIAKAWLAAWAWQQVYRRHLLLGRTIAAYFGGWIFASALLVGLAWMAVPDTQWLRPMLLLVAILVLPLAGPPLTMLALANHRKK